MPKVSVVIPIFGVEKYIARCANSLFRQTLQDIEYIFVDDCTQDKSVDVLMEVICKFPNRKNQIKIIRHQKNRGLSRARETGVNAATGEYIAHCDSDDWVEVEMYEKLYDYAIQYGCDFVKCQHYISNDLDDITIKSPVVEKGLLEKDSIIKQLLLEKGWNSVWNILVRCDVYRKNIQFTDAAMLEDYVVTTQLLLNSSKIGYVETPLYHYYINPNSICKRASEKDYIRRAQQAYHNARIVLQNIVQVYGDKKYKEETIVLKYIARRMLIPIMNNTDNYWLWNKIFPELYFKPVISKYFTLKEKIQYFMVQAHLYHIYCYFIK